MFLTATNEEKFPKFSGALFSDIDKQSAYIYYQELLLKSQNDIQSCTPINSYKRGNICIFCIYHLLCSIYAPA